MKRLALLPLIALAVAACHDTTAAPTSVAAPSAAITVTINDDNAPSGTHLQRGAIGCALAAGPSVDCSAFELAGVGNTNITIDLDADFTAVVDCFNPGDPKNSNNPIESHEESFSAEETFVVASTKNGRLSVQRTSLAADPDVVGCPNPNWDPRIRPGTLVLLSFTFTATFAGFTSPFITITGP